MSLREVIVVLIYIAVIIFFVVTWRRSGKYSDKYEAERPAIERRERIKLLWYIASAPTGVTADRARARDDLEHLIAVEGYGVEEK